MPIDRTGASAIGTMSIDEAWRAIHHDTLFLLRGMMIRIANLRLNGFFALAGHAIFRRAHHPITLLAAIAAPVEVFGALLAIEVDKLLLWKSLIASTLNPSANGSTGTSWSCSPASSSP